VLNKPTAELVNCLAVMIASLLAEPVFAAFSQIAFHGHRVDLVNCFDAAV
jgi:hypothetical protein